MSLKFNTTLNCHKIRHSNHTKNGKIQVQVQIEQTSPKYTFSTRQSVNPHKKNREKRKKLYKTITRENRLLRQISEYISLSTCYLEFET